MGVYRDVPQILKTVKPHVPLKTFKDIEQILTVGTPTVFNGESSQENYNEYQKYRNHPAVAKYDKKIAKIINKEKCNKHLMVLPSWFQQFIRNLHTTPQSLVVIPDKNNCLVWDGMLRL